MISRMIVLHSIVRSSYLNKNIYLACIGLSWESSNTTMTDPQNKQTIRCDETSTVWSGAKDEVARIVFKAKQRPLGAAELFSNECLEICVGMKCFWVWRMQWVVRLQICSPRAWLSSSTAFMLLISAPVSRLWIDSQTLYSENFFCSNHLIWLPASPPCQHSNTHLHPAFYRYNTEFLLWEGNWQSYISWKLMVSSIEPECVVTHAFAWLMFS